MRLNFRRWVPLGNSFWRWPQRSSFHPWSSAQVLSYEIPLALCVVVPVLIVFVIFQRWITEGIATTGLKG